MITATRLVTHGTTAKARKYREKEQTVRTLMLLAAVTAATAVCATASAATDPRVCSTATPGGTAKHGYWCAKAAATDAVRKTMAARQHQTRWFYPVFCDEHGTLLRWACVTTGGGQSWHAAVTFTKTTAGWRARVAVT